MRHKIRNPLARCFAGRASENFWVYTRITGSRVELDVVHLPSGYRYVSRADDFETAAEELTRLIEMTRSSHRPEAQTLPARRLQPVWKRASDAVLRALLARSA